MSYRDSSTRRKILLALGSGLFGATQLPKTWTKPVVDSVLLPVHAATTDTDSGSEEQTVPTEFYDSITFTSEVVHNSIFEDALSVVVQDAYAGGGFRPAQGEMCIKVTPPAGPGARYSAKVLLNDEKGGLEGVYIATGTVGGGVELMQLDSGCQVVNNLLTLDVSSVSAVGAKYMVSNNLDDRVSVGTLPPGTECPADSTCSNNGA